MCTVVSFTVACGLCLDSPPAILPTKAFQGVGITASAAKVGDLASPGDQQQENKLCS